MSDLQELYQEVILDHNRKPRNSGVLEDATHSAEGKNPLCGDHVFVDVRMDGDVISDIRFHGEGCAISRASASLMTSAVKGKTREQAEALFHRFHALVTGTEPANSDGPDLGQLVVFSGVPRYPVRVKCASLAWHTLRAALAGEKHSQGEPPSVSTE